MSRKRPREITDDSSDEEDEVCSREEPNSDRKDNSSCPTHVEDPEPEASTVSNDPILRDSQF